MTFTPRITFAAVAFALLSALPAHAEDAVAVADPAADFVAQLDKLLPPSDTSGFVFDGHILVNGGLMGTVKLEAKLVTEDGKQAWHITDSMHASAMGTKLATSTWDLHLRPISGVLTKTSSTAETETYPWSRTKTGATWSKSTSSDSTDKAIEFKGPLTVGIAHIALFSKLSGHAKGPFRASFLKVEEGEIITVNWTAGEMGMWAGERARIVKGSRSDKRNLEMAFDMATGELLGVKLFDDVMKAEFKPGKPAPAKEEFFDELATTPQQAAAQLVFSFATANFEVLERVTHWPSIYKQMAAQDQKMADLGEDGVKGLLMGQFRRTLTPQIPAEQLGPLLEGMVASLTPEKQADGDSLVTFPPVFKSLKVHVREIDGTWYAVQFPGAPSEEAPEDEPKAPKAPEDAPETDND